MLYISVALITLILSGCDTVKNSLGLTHQNPDEFAVPDTAPLTLPPDYNLLPPPEGNTDPKMITKTSQSGEKSIQAAKAVLSGPRAKNVG